MLDFALRVEDVVVFLPVTGHWTLSLKVENITLQKRAFPTSIGLCRTEITINIYIGGFCDAFYCDTSNLPCGSLC